MGKFYAPPSREGLDDKRALHGSQSAAHPFTRGGTVFLAAPPKGRGIEDTVVYVGEGPDAGVGSTSSGNGTKLIA